MNFGDPWQMIEQQIYQESKPWKQVSQKRNDGKEIEQGREQKNTGRWESLKASEYNTKEA